MESKESTEEMNQQNNVTSRKSNDHQIHKQLIEHEPEGDQDLDQDHEREDDQDSDEDELDSDEEEEQHHHLWTEVHPANSPTSLRNSRNRSHRIPSITSIDPPQELIKLTSNNFNSSSSNSFIDEISINSHQTNQIPSVNPSHHLITSNISSIPSNTNPATPTPTEEWRSKILNSVRIGEQKVAQRRKQSTASILPSHASSSIITSSSTTFQRDPLTTSYIQQEPSPSAAQFPPSDDLPSIPSGPSSSIELTQCIPSDSKGKQPLKQFYPANIPTHPSNADSNTHSISTTLASNSSLTDFDLPASNISKSFSNNNPYLQLLQQSHQPQAQTNNHSGIPIPFKPDSVFNDKAHLTLESHKSTTHTPDSIANQSPSSHPTSSSHFHHPHHVRSNSSNTPHSASNPVSINALTRNDSALGGTNDLPNTSNHPFEVPQLAESSSTIETSNAFPDEPPPPVDGTFITIFEPALSSRLALVTPLSDSPPSTSPQPNPAVNNNVSNQLSDLHPQPSTVRSSSATRSKTGKRSFFSTLLQRASGSNSGPNSPAASPSPGIMARNPFESTANRASNSPHSDNYRASNNRSGSDHLQPSPSQPPDSTDSGKRTSSGMDVTLYATASTLASLHLSLTPLTPQLPASRNSQPLCGAILDEKFLLIGTNNGLDFVPLTPSYSKSSSNHTSGPSSNSIATIKPISLIKKTRFKSLKVLEVRSNILLAIAGRNDHLRVYALDGIRAIITKKLQDLEEKEQVVWFPKSLTRAIPSKGKERIQAQPATTNSPQYSPPPPYGGNNLASEQTITKSNSFQPTKSIGHGTPSSISANLRRSSTLGSRVHNPAGISTSHSSVVDTRRSSFHSAFDSLPFIPINGTAAVSDLQVLRTGHPQLSSENANHTNDMPNHDDHPFFARDRLNNPRITDGSATRPDHNLISGNGDHGGTGTGLVEIIKKRSEQLGASVKQASNLVPSLSNSGSRLVPRSALATPAANASSDNNHLQLADLLSQNSTGSPTISIRSSTPASTLPAVVPPGNDDRLEINIIDDPAELPDPRYGPSPSLRPQPNLTPDASTSGNMAQSDNDLPPRQPTRATSRVRPVTHHSDHEGQSGTNLTLPAKSKKRWSVMDSVFRTHSHSSSSYPATSSSVFGTAAHPTTRASTDDGLASRSVSSNRPADSLAVEPTIRSRMSTQKLRPTASGSNSELIGGNTAITTGSVGVVAGQGAANANATSSTLPDSTGPSSDPPPERLATHFHGQSTSETAKTSPHPATLGAPLEYVKLARTKGAKLLRAFETKRRTYLAVLCGDSSERIELFTGSKNISLSLNRTFVLPETPRTIEFQMQGDDLVDIYLVYDQSVFALEPATVRVREVGIGRNERRAARRERERAVRDLASINMRPSVTGSGTRNTDRSDSTLGFQSDTPESLVEAMELAERTSASTVSPAVDYGITLSAPISSFRPNTTGNSSGLASVWGAPETHVGSGNLGNGTVKVTNLWPYSTFQQLQFIPPLPPSVLASTFVIPPTYEAVVTASEVPKLSVPTNLNSETPHEESSRALSQIKVLEPDSENLMIPLNITIDRLSTRSSSSFEGEVEGGGENQGRAGSPTIRNLRNIELIQAANSAFGQSSDLEVESSLNGGDNNDASPVPQTIDSSNSFGDQYGQQQSILSEGPLLSPISLLANPSNRQIGPPGLFLVTRGKKVTSIVDCDGRSVMKKPFIWTNDKNSKPITTNAEMNSTSGSINSNNYGFRIEVIIANENRTILVGIDNLDVKIFEVGGLYHAKGLEDFSNSATLDIVPPLILNPNYQSHSSDNNNTSISHGGAVGAVGGGCGVGVMTAQNFINSPASSASHHPNMHLSGLGSLSIGLGSAAGLVSGIASNTTSSSTAVANESPFTSGKGSNNNSSNPNVNPSGIMGLGDREIVFLASSNLRNQVVWSERSNGYFVVYSLASQSSFSTPFLQSASDS